MIKKKKYRRVGVPGALRGELSHRFYSTPPSPRFWRVPYMAIDMRRMWNIIYAYIAEFMYVHL
jgi:hypothetical protein